MTYLQLLNQPAKLASVWLALALLVACVEETENTGTDLGRLKDSGTPEASANPEFSPTAETSETANESASSQPDASVAQALRSSAPPASAWPADTPPEVIECYSRPFDTCELDERCVLGTGQGYNVEETCHDPEPQPISCGLKKLASNSLNYGRDPNGRCWITLPGFVMGPGWEYTCLRTLPCKAG
jgi:hypothetical protein